MNPLITEIDSFPSNTSQNDILKWSKKLIFGTFPQKMCTKLFRNYIIMDDL